MPKERLKNPRLRLFVALELPASTRALLAEWQRDLVRAGGEELRAASADSLHVTLAFLGHRYERDLESIARAVGAAAPCAVSLAFGPVPVPKPANRPRLYAAALEAADSLLELRAETVARLSSDAGFKDERRAYWPHVTLCRVKSSVKRHSPVEPLPAAPSGLAEPAAATALTLFSSELLPSGARHTALASVPLPAASV